MAKVKKRLVKEEDNRANSVIYYELIGLVAIFLAIIIFNELGTIGYYSRLFLKVMFGDWYWVINIFIFLTGVRLIYKHDYIDYHSLRVIGATSVVLALLMLSHVKVFEYLERTNENVLYGTWNYYISYLTTKSSDFILGGGLLGGIFYTLINFLLGSFGTVLISLLMLFSGISFLFEKTIHESLVGINKTFSKTFNNFSSLKKFFKYEINRNEKITKNVKEKTRKKLTLTEKEVKYDFNLQENVSKVISVDIKQILYSLNINFTSYHYKTNYAFTAYIFDVRGNFDKDKTFSKIKKLTNDLAIVFYNLKKNRVKIEIPNTYVKNLNLKNFYNPKVENCLTLGVESENKLKYLNLKEEGCLLVAGSYQNENIAYINMLLLEIIYKYSKNDYEFWFLDKKNNFRNFFGQRFDSFEEILKQSSEIIDLRMYEKRNKNIFIVLNNFEEYYHYKYESKFMFNLQTSVSTNIYYLINSNRVIEQQSLINFIQNKIVLKMHNYDLSEQLTKSDYGIHLQKSGDILYVYKGGVKRIYAPIVSTREVEKYYK